jgi:PAS domain S-box-containing protein
MPYTLPQQTLSNWFLPTLGLMVLLVVVVPFAFVDRAAADAERAAAMVLHSHQVEARLHQLAGDMRNLEAAALALGNGIDNPVVRERIAEADTRLVPTLQELQALTRDHAAQQVRLGALQSHVLLRQANAEGIIDSGATASVADLDSMIARYPIHGLVNAILAEERKLLVAREARAQRVQQRAEVARWLAVCGQLLLLGLALAYAWRQISHRQRAEATAQRVRDRAVVVLDTVREPIAAVDRELRVVMHNVAFAELYGVDGEVRGQPLSTIGDGAWSQEHLLRRLSDVLSRGRELWDHELLQRTADGAERTMLINARRMPLPDREDPVALVTASDISPQKASDRQIRELNRQLEGKIGQLSEVNRELEAFTYSVSHDLRAPLRHIVGFGEKLGRHLGDDADDKSRHYLDVMVSSARRLSRLIEDLLVYSRLGRGALRLQPVDMQSLASETRAMLEANLAGEQPGHVVEWRIAPLPVVVGDENMLRQVWQNLLGNAVKYSRDREPARIEVGYRRGADGSHHFHVRDNGAGFDMQYADKLFGVFQRLHSASEFPGTGIGLANVRRVLARHGGSIHAEAEPGAGATFHFVLPAAADEHHPDTRTP